MLSVAVLQTIENYHFSFDKFIQCVVNVRNECKEISSVDTKNFFQYPQWDAIERDLFDSVFLSQSQKINIEDDFATLKKNTKRLFDIFTDKREAANNSLRNVAVDYLSSYYALISTLKREDIIKDESIIYSSLLLSLMTGYKNKTIEDGDFFYRFYSPVMIEKFVIIYDYINSVYIPAKKERISKGQSDSNFEKIYEDLLKEKIRRMFFMNVAINGDSQVVSHDNVLFPRISRRQSLSSVEMVKPIRWLSKIRALVDQKNQSKDKTNNFDIAIIGYIKEEEIGDDDKEIYKELYDLYATIIQLYKNCREEERKSFNITVYINESDFHFKSDDFTEKELNFPYDKLCKIKVVLKKVDYKRTFTPKYIDNMFAEYDMVLMLDVPSLYLCNFKIVDDGRLIIPISDADNEYHQLLDMLDGESLILSHSYRKAPIHSLIAYMNILSVDSDLETSSLHYQINENILDSFEEKIKSDDCKCRFVHILLSSATSVAGSEWSYKKNVVREERYNGKTFRLITLKKGECDLITRFNGENKKKNWFTFSLWNMVRNIDINFINQIFKNVSAESYYMLMNTLIKLEFSSEFERFDITYKIYDKCNEESKKVIERFINYVFEIILSNDNDIIKNCIRISFYNTIYSQIQCLDDAVFYCLFRTRNWTNINPAKKIERLENGAISSNAVLSLLQPERWTVVRAINEMQTDSVTSHQFYSLVNELNENGFSYIKLFEDIKQICEEYGYRKNLLYCNISHISE